MKYIYCRSFQNSAKSLFQEYLETNFLFGKNGAIETGLSIANEVLLHFQVSGIKHVERITSPVQIINVSQKHGNVIIVRTVWMVLMKVIAVSKFVGYGF